ncbi:MAG: cobalamin biosynthesis protein, partial [Pseudomonadota bacterium]
MTGQYMVIGMGPGAADLLTLRARDRLRDADVVAYPETTRGSFAARTGQGLIEGAIQLPFTVPMTGDGAADLAYDAAAEAIADHMAQGRTVALLCEGDALLYGSAGSLMTRLGPPAEIVPGVTAASASCAAAGVSLARGDTPVTILPATLPAASLRRALRGAEPLVLYKVGRHFDDVAALIRASGRTGTLVSRATLDDETVIPLGKAPPGPKPYFSTILLPGREGMPTSMDRAPHATVGIIALAPSALPVAQEAKAALARKGEHAVIHGLARRFEPQDVDVLFSDAQAMIAQLFAERSPIVGICAAGILIRAVAPFVSDKGSEPPVIAVAEDGSAVVPLLGTHSGGAALARVIGDALNKPVAFTTRGEVRHGLGLDDPPAGFVVADPQPFKALAAVDGGPGRADTSLTFLPEDRSFSVDISATIARSEHASPRYIVKRVALGIGAERGADEGAAIALAEDALGDANIDPRAVAAVVSIDLKADEAAVAAVAEALNAPLRLFGGTELAAEEHRLKNPSEAVRRCIGIPGVAEASALAAAGPDGTLLLEKRARDRVTIAIAA